MLKNDYCSECDGSLVDGHREHCQGDSGGLLAPGSRASAASFSFNHQKAELSGTKQVERPGRKKVEEPTEKKEDSVREVNEFELSHLPEPEKLGHFFRYNRSAMVSPAIGGTISKNQAFASFSNLGQQEEVKYFMEYRLKEGMSRNNEEHNKLYRKSHDDATAMKLKTKESVVSSYLKARQPNMDPIALGEVEKLNQLQIRFQETTAAEQEDERIEDRSDQK